MLYHLYLKFFQRFIWYIEHTEDIEELWKLKKNKAKDLTKNEEIPFFKVFTSNQFFAISGYYISVTPLSAYGMCRLPSFRYWRCDDCCL